jgi:hypothetical protein
LDSHALQASFEIPTPKESNSTVANNTPSPPWLQEQAIEAPIDKESQSFAGVNNQLLPANFPHS